MGRVRFSWDNLPGPVLRALARDLGLPGDPGVALRRSYGVRPKEEFVQQAWPALRDEWLGRDRDAREAVVEALRERGLGDLSVEVRSAAGQRHYLTTCRNSASLRHVVHGALIAAGELAPPGDDGERGDTATATDALHQGADEDTVRDKVLRLLRAASGEPDLVPDEDGDIPLRFGSGMVFVRVFGSPPVIRVFSPVIGDVDVTSSLVTEVNRLNQQYLFVKWLALEDAVVAAVELFGSPLVPDHLVAACTLLGQTIDSVDDRLQEEYGGRTFFSDVVHRSPPENSGYL